MRCVPRLKTFSANRADLFFLGRDAKKKMGLCASVLQWASLLQSCRGTSDKLQGLLDDPVRRVSSVFEHPHVYLLETEEPGIFLDLGKDQKIHLTYLVPRAGNEKPNA